jgi:hypothetical protein
MIIPIYIVGYIIEGMRIYCGWAALQQFTIVRIFSVSLRNAPEELPATAVRGVTLAETQGVRPEIITGNRRQFMHCGSMYGSYPIAINGGMTTMYKRMYIAVIYGIHKR